MVQYGSALAPRRLTRSTLKRDALQLLEIEKESKKESQDWENTADFLLGCLAAGTELSLEPDDKDNKDTTAARFDVDRVYRKSRSTRDRDSFVMVFKLNKESNPANDYSPPKQDHTLPSTDPTLATQGDASCADPEDCQDAEIGRLIKVQAAMESSSPPVSSLFDTTCKTTGEPSLADNDTQWSFEPQITTTESTTKTLKIYLSATPVWETFFTEANAEFCRLVCSYLAVCDTPLAIGIAAKGIVHRWKEENQGKLLYGDRFEEQDLNEKLAEHRVRLLVTDAVENNQVLSDEAHAMPELSIPTPIAGSVDALTDSARNNKVLPESPNGAAAPQVSDPTPSDSGSPETTLSPIVSAQALSSFQPTVGTINKSTFKPVGTSESSKPKALPVVQSIPSCHPTKSSGVKRKQSSSTSLVQLGPHDVVLAKCNQELFVNQLFSTFIEDHVFDYRTFTPDVDKDAVIVEAAKVWTEEKGGRVFQSLCGDSDMFRQLPLDEVQAFCSYRIKSTLWKPTKKCGPKDVLFGMHGLTFRREDHAGNQVFEQLVKSHVAEFKTAAPVRRCKIATAIVDSIYNDSKGGCSFRKLLDKQVAKTKWTWTTCPREEAIECTKTFLERQAGIPHEISSKPIAVMGPVSPAPAAKKPKLPLVAEPSLALSSPPRPAAVSPETTSPLFDFMHDQDGESLVAHAFFTPIFSDDDFEEGDIAVAPVVVEPDSDAAVVSSDV